MSMKALIEHPDFDNLYAKGFESRPVVCFDRGRNQKEPEVYTQQECNELVQLVVESLPEYKVATTWNGEGTTRFSLSMKLKGGL